MGTFGDGMGIFLALEALDRDSITQDHHSLSCSRNFFFSGHVYFMVTDKKRAEFPVLLRSGLEEWGEHSGAHTPRPRLLGVVRVPEPPLLLLLGTVRRPHG